MTCMNEGQTTGRCLCGAVRFAFEGPLNWTCHCHCESCRRATSSPMTSFLGVPLQTFRWTGEAPKVFRSSPGVERLFCGKCGSQMAFLAEHYPGEIHLYAASLDDPEAFEAEMHVHHEERLAWFETTDNLPRKVGFAD
ncbi:MAG: GFA family protein [Pseudomonadota bacterium]